jgi:hypothetical protein
MLRKSEVCAIDFPIAAATLRPALAAGLKIGAAFETEITGEGFFYLNRR